MSEDFIIHSPADLEGWTRCFDVEALPILGDTVDAIELLQSKEDAVDARLLSESISADPLLSPAPAP